jgi:hypothetical protein
VVNNNAPTLAKIGQTIPEFGRHPRNVQRGTIDAFDQRRNQEMFL